MRLVLKVSVPKRFRIVRQLGEGGMGIVYEAYDEERQARVALKTVRELNAESLARFKREFRALADVHHPNVVTLGELFTEGRDWFFSMELVEGEDFLGYVRPTDNRLRLAALDSTGTRPSDGTLAVAPTVRFERQEQARFDEARLRSALGQLTEALSALHAAGVVHRDIKPSNIRVTPAGRLVLLDFGLAIDATKERSTALKMGGTPIYMAPEQALSGDVGPEADFYAVGVLLYEALTGAVPFEGAPLEILMKKQSHTPEPPRALVPGVPGDLDALCVALLQFDRNARPTAARVRRVLGTTVSGSASRTSVTEQSAFVGRKKELEALRAAFEDSRDGVAVSVLVEGESGVGKSCLVRRFVTALSVEHPDVVVLTGRCYEREAVPYKALDGVVDSLARVLVREGETLANQILPVRPGPLAQVFPVLRRVAAFAKATRGPVTVADPVDLRNRAFATMREMLTRLAARRPCVVVIDDLQWADADSLALLAEIMRPPDEPPLLLVATVRVASPDATDAPPPPDRIAAALAGRARTITMAPMPDDDARELTARLLERGAPGSAHFAETIAREAGGHPLFIDALVRHSVATGAAAGSMRLEDALWAHVASLAPGPQRVMQILAVAGAPVTHEVLADAVGGDRNELERHVSLLRVAHLASITGPRSSDTIEPYHDRVRGAVLANLGQEDRVASHRALAIALEQAPRPDAQALVLHWRAAGDSVQAARYALLAADEAAAALAFDRAAAFYQTAIELGQQSGAARSALLEKLGDALSNAGRGERAAEAYADASQGAPAARSLDLQRRGADQLLRSGLFDQGLTAIGRVLAAFGLALPRSSVSALLIFVAYRLYLRVRGLGFRPRDESEIRATDLTRIDICWSLAFGLGMVDPLSGAAFNARNLLLALQSGERYRIARAIAVEAAFMSALSAGSSIRRIEAILERAHALADESGNAHAIAWAHGTSGVADYQFGRYKSAIVHMDRAKALFAEVPGAIWEQDTMLSLSTDCLVQLGEIGRVTRDVPKAEREARQRGHLYQSINLRIGLANIAWLATDGVEAALAKIDEAMSEWSKPGFRLEHYYELIARTNALLYSGRGHDAHRYIRGRWPALRRSLLPLTIQKLRVHSLQARARTAIAASEQGAPDRARLLHEAARSAGRIEGERTAWATPGATLLRAGVAAETGASDRAVALLRDAVAGFDAVDMALYAAASRRTLGKLIGGEEGRALVRGAEDWMTSEAIRDPARMTAMLAPGFAKHD